MLRLSNIKCLIGTKIEEKFLIKKVANVLNYLS